MGGLGSMSKSWCGAIVFAASVFAPGCGQDEPAPDAQVFIRGQPESVPTPVAGGFAGMVEVAAPCETGALTLRVHSADGTTLYARRYELSDPDWHETGAGLARYFALNEADRERQAPAQAQAPFELRAIYDPAGLLEPPATARAARAAVQPGERSISIAIPGTLSGQVR